MKKIEDALSLLKQRPNLWLGVSFFMLPLCLFEYLILFPLIYGITSIGTGNVYEVIIYCIQFIMAGVNHLKKGTSGNIFIFSFFCVSVLLSSFSAAGYFHCINEALNGREARFREGIKRFFVRVNVIFMIFVVSSLAFFFFSVIISLPALVLTRSVTANKANMDMLVNYSLIIVNVTTVLVLLFQVVLGLMYFSYWFASIYHFGKKSFQVAKRMVNAFFWRLSLKTILFIFLFLVLEWALATTDIWLTKNLVSEVVVVFVIVFANSILKALFLTLYVMQVFKSFICRKNVVT